MNHSRRLEKGGRIDRHRPLNFTFNGTAYCGFEGDTLASALLANGVRVVGRSLKFHRPHGIVSAGVEESNALLAVDTGNGPVPLQRATLIRLSEGLDARSENCFPSLGFDVGRLLDLTRRLWPAGFYNKMFKWPSWHVYEWAIRAVAGLGRVPETIDQTRYRHLNTHCDVLIVGAGPAGIARAMHEARRGLDVLIVEQDVEAGGSALYCSAEIDSKPANDWLEASLKELRSCPNVHLMLNATVCAYYDHNVLTIEDRSRSSKTHAVETFWKVRADQVVLATGAIEQPVLFGDNDLPGIMLTGAMHQYAVRFGLCFTSSTVAVVNNDFAWYSALTLHDAGSFVLAIVDAREDIRAELSAAAAERGIAVHAGCSPLRALGSNSVAGLEIEDQHGRRTSLSCRFIAMSSGLNPTVHLYSQAGGKLKYDTLQACFVPDHCRQNVEVIGHAAGNFGDTYLIAERKVSSYRRDAQWVDLAHDVLVSDIELAVRENMTSVEHVKRYTTVGMAVDQGKTSNLNALTVLAQLTARKPGEVGTTTYRPQYMPVTMGTIAGNRQGNLYRPSRRLVAHEWHAAHGAVFDDFGLWKRPAYYGSDLTEATNAEIHTVRSNAGVFDGSPLGKIEVKGPDAAVFLGRIYVNTVATLKVGKVRYGIMLNENGIVIDDGVFARIADDHFLVNTSSAGADRIAAWLEHWHQCEWPELEVVISPVTSQWSVATVAGPKSRAILQSLTGIGDISAAAFPHMSFKQGKLDDGSEFRLQRVSFTGEQSYELSVPAGCNTEILDRLMKVGQPYGLRPFGVEALEVMRLEKGFLHVGADTDSTTSPADIGFAGIIAKKTTDFIGKRSLSRPDNLRPDRRQLVGVEPSSERDVINVGAHVVHGCGDSLASQGFITSSAFSPTLSRRVGLALIENGFSRFGDQVQIYDKGQLSTVSIVKPGAYDPGGERMNA